MLGKPATPEAYKLFHEGAIALSQVEQNGIRIDEDRLRWRINKIDRKIKRIEEELKDDPIYKKWEKRYGSKTKIGSRDQLAQVLFVDMGYKCKNWTEGKKDKYGKVVKRPKADETNLKDTGLPFVDKYIRRSKLVMAKSNWLSGIERELCEGRIHPFFNLSGGTSDEKGDPRTYRSSAADPQVHNFPKRDEEQSKIVRETVIPSDDDYVILEADFKGIEVSIAYCYHMDPVMRKYLLTKGADMHRDVAIQVFFLENEPHTPEWWKDESRGGGYHSRYSAKNKFTFPQFYGDYWLNCAKNLWEDIDRLHLHTPSGVPMYDHLKKHGIKRLGDQDPTDAKKGTYEFHLKDIQSDFWDNRFKVYGAWRKSWYEKFTKRGWFRMKTGFVCTGTYTRNQVINYPVQGAAFHCLLWCLIKLQKWLNKNKMKSKIISEIHDSLILDCHKSEVHKVVTKIRQIMREELLENWKWIVIPLEVDIGVSDTNWSETVSYEKFYGVAA